MNMAGIGLRLLPFGLLVGVITLSCGYLTWNDARWLWSDDFQIQYLPVMLEIGEALSQGEWPVLSEHMWHGGNLAGEYQYGLFSVVVLGLNWLIFNLDFSLSGKATLLVGVYQLILANGIYQLARQRELAIEWALFAAVGGALSSWLLYWGRSWFPALASFAWLPWLWWALEGLYRDQRDTASDLAVAGVFVYLVISAGWPHTVGMIGLLSAWLVLRACVERRSMRPVMMMIGVWTIGLGLSAPALLTMFEHYTVEVRSIQIEFAGSGNVWRVPGSALLNLFFPFIYQTWDWFLGKIYYPGVEVFTGLAPVALILSGLLLMGRDVLRTYRWELGLLLVGLVLIQLPSFEPFRWSFRWLPLVQLMFMLLAAELGGMLSVRWASGLSWRARMMPEHNPGVVCIALAIVVYGYASLTGATVNFVIAIRLVAVALVWGIAMILLAPRPRGFGQTAVLAVLAFQWVNFAGVIDTNTYTVRTWALDEYMVDPGPLETGRRYFSLSDWEAVYTDPLTYTPGFGATLRPGNTWAYAGLEGINGYTPIGHAGLLLKFRMRWAGVFSPEIVRGMLSAWPTYSRMLDLMGVDGLVIKPTYAAGLSALLQRQGWSLVAETSEATVLHRDRSGEQVHVVDPTGLCLVSEQSFRPQGVQALVNRTSCVSPGKVSSKDQVDVELLSEHRTSVRAQVVDDDGMLPKIIAFSRLWFPGYEVRLDGKQLPLLLVEGILPAVRLPGDAQGELELVYRPVSQRVGLFISAMTLLLTGLIVWRYRARQ
ncbi:MAG: hypothetical protein V3R81_10470 [Gammaproteobacteria bacterium]